MKKLLLPVLIGFVFLSACEFEKTSNEPGSIVLKVTDSPFPIELIEDVGLTITKVVVMESEEDSASSHVLFDDTISISLNDLRNGITEELSNVEVPPGYYNQIRVFVTDTYIKLYDYDVFELKVPSGSSSGIKIKINPAVRVEGGLTTELLLDFDVSKSFVLKGNMNTPAGIKGFNFKPVIRAVNNTVAGRLAGIVSDTSQNLLANANIVLEQDSVIASSFSDST